MKKLLFIAAIFTGVIAFALGCSKSSEDMFAVPVCDTAGMRYSTDVTNILSASCYRCHGATSNGGSGGIVLEGYDNLKMWADNGFLIGNITHAPGYIPMPFDGGKLSDCEINKIQAWIDQGTKNN